MKKKGTYSFGRSERLKSRKQIQLLFASGNQFSHFPFRLYWSPLNPQQTLQAAVAVSTRQFGKAVDRNRIKRMMREAWRLNRIPLQEALKQENRGLTVCIIYVGNSLPAWDEVSQKMKGAIGRLQKLSHAMDQSPA